MYKCEPSASMKSIAEKLNLLYPDNYFKYNTSRVNKLLQDCRIEIYRLRRYAIKFGIDDTLQSHSTEYFYELLDKLEKEDKEESGV